MTSPDALPAPAPHRLVTVALVFAGGAVGTGLRQLVNGIVASGVALPVGILVINISGAFALGWLSEFTRRINNPHLRSRLHHFLGVGMLGGYTTYSALAGDAARLLASGEVLLAAGYALGSVVLGVAAAALGIWAGRGTAPG